MAVLRADPWNPDFGMGFEAPLEDSTPPRADPGVETKDWRSPLSPAGSAEVPVWFVDGVRRVELRVLADDRGRRVPGLFGSFAVGAVRCDGRAEFDEHRVCRSIVLGGGIRAERVDIDCGRERVSFEPAVESRIDTNAPIERLQELMRDEENALAATLVGLGAPLVVVDGPLRLGEEGDRPVVGVVKRFVRRYLDPEHEALLSQLQRGQRTPVFALLDQDDTVRGYSWYARLTELRAPWHDHAGIVRCEVRAAVGLDAAVAMAERVTALLPRYAGRASDPRTPQNLAPVAGLEGWLRHRMGDRALIRRALVTWLARGMT